MEEFLALYSEAGMIGVVGAMFVFMVYQNAKRSDQQADDLEDLKVENQGQSKQIAEILKEVEESKQIIVRLIDRFNKSDDTSLRYREDVMREIGDLSEKIAYQSGKINGK